MPTFYAYRRIQVAKAKPVAYAVLSILIATAAIALHAAPTTMSKVLRAVALFALFMFLHAKSERMAQRSGTDTRQLAMRVDSEGVYIATWSNKVIQWNNIAGVQLRSQVNQASVYRFGVVSLIDAGIDPPARRRMTEKWFGPRRLTFDLQGTNTDFGTLADTLKHYRIDLEDKTGGETAMVGVYILASLLSLFG